jgi:predicted nucleic acid-binding protein
VKTLVIDASVAAKWLFPEERSAAARRLLSPKCRLIAPDLIYAEVGNVIWKRVRRRELSPEEGPAILGDFLRFPLEILPSATFLPSALELAIVTGRTVYDCLYLALAIIERSTLVTADERFTKALSQFPIAKHVRMLGTSK